MKKSTKIALIAAGFLILFGVVLAIIGMSFGAGKLLAESAGYYDLDVDMSNIPLFGWDDSYVGDGEEEYSGKFSSVEVADIKDVEDINIKIGVAALYIRESEDNMIRMETNTNGKIECYVENNELYLEGIEYDYPRMRWDDEIYLYLPKKGTFDTVNLEVGAGMIYCEDIKAQDMEANIGAGKIECKRIEAEEFVGKAGAGHLALEESIIGEGEFIVEAGNIEYEGILEGNLRAACDIGSMNLRLSGNEEDQNYDLDCEMGKIEIGNREYAHMSNDSYINNDASNTYEIDCNMGAVTIKFK